MKNFLNTMASIIVFLAIIIGAFLLHPIVGVIMICFIVLGLTN